MKTSFNKNSGNFSKPNAVAKNNKSFAQGNNKTNNRSGKTGGISGGRGQQTGFNSNVNKKSPRGGFGGHSNSGGGSGRGGRATQPFGKLRQNKSSYKTSFQDAEDEDTLSFPVPWPNYYIPQGAKYQEPYLTLEEMIKGGIKDIIPNGELQRKETKQFPRLSMKLLFNDGKSTFRKPLIECDVFSEYGISEQKKKENEEDDSKGGGWSIALEASQNESLKNFSDAVVARIEEWVRENKVEVAKLFNTPIEKFSFCVKNNFRQSTKSKATNKPYRWTFSVYPGGTGVGCLVKPEKKEDKEGKEAKEAKEAKEDKEKQNDPSKNKSETNTEEVAENKSNEMIQQDLSWYRFVQDDHVSRPGRYLLRFVLDHLDFTGGGDTPLIMLNTFIM
jgi:hypothetical protein